MLLSVSILASGLLSWLVVINEGKTLLHIGGFIEVNTTNKGWSSAGVRPAIDLAVRHINDRSDILPDHTIQMHWIDTKCSDAYAIKALIEQLRKPPTKVALLGPGCSISAIPVAAASHFWNLVQMGFSAASPRLSDKTRYPLFFRTNAPETILNMALASLLRRFDWNRIAIIKQDQDLFNDAHEHLQAILKKEGISVITANSFVEETDNVITDLKEKKARIIISMMYADKCRLIMCAAFRHDFYGSHIQWLLPGWYSPDWWKVNDATGCSPKDIQTVAGNFISVEDKTIDNTVGRTDIGLTADEFLKLYEAELENYHYSSNNYASFGYDATWALAMALNQSATKNHSLESFSYEDAAFALELSNTLSSTSILGVSGLIQFNANQERMNKIWIEQFQGGEEVRLGYFDPETHNVSQGEITINPGKDFKWPDGRPPRDDDLVIEPHVQTSLTLFIVMSSIAGAGMMMACGFLFVNYRFRSHRVVRQSSPRLNNVIVIGCILSYCCVFVYGSEAFTESHSVQSLICKIRWWMVSLAYTLAFGTMFLKTWRVYKIFTNKQLNKELMLLHDRHLFAVLCGLLCLDIAYLTAWEISDPITSSHLHLSKKISSHGDTVIQGYAFICVSGNEGYWMAGWAAWKGLLLVLGLFLAWETRNVNFAALNDSKYVGMSVYNVVILTLITLSVSLVIGRESINAKYALFGTAFNVISTFTLLLLFVPKIAKLKGRTYPLAENAPTEVGGSFQIDSYFEHRRHPACASCKCN